MKAAGVEFIDENGGGPGVRLTAFTDFGVENLAEIVKVYKADPDLLRRYPPRK